MTRNAKLFLMFAPLVVTLASIGVVAADLKNPISEERDSCLIVATGKEASAFRTPSNILSDEGGDRLYDIAMRCKQKGNVVVNDREPFRLGTVFKGNGVLISKKHYHLWPGFWRLSIQNPVGEADPKASQS